MYIISLAASYLFIGFFIGLFEINRIRREYDLEKITAIHIVELHIIKWPVFLLTRLGIYLCEPFSEDEENENDSPKV